MITAMTPVIQVLTNADATLIAAIPAGTIITASLFIENTDVYPRYVYIHVRTGAAAQGNAILWNAVIYPNKPIVIELDPLPATWIVSGKADLGAEVNVLVAGSQET